MDLEHQQFVTADVLAASGLKPGTLDAWLARGHLVVDPGPGTGRARSYDFDTVVHIAIVARLVSLGFTARAASDAAENSLRGVHRGDNFLILVPPSESVPGGVNWIKCDHVSEIAQFFPLFPDGPPAVYAVVDLRAIAAEVEARLIERLKEREADSE